MSGLEEEEEEVRQSQQGLCPRDVGWAASHTLGLDGCFCPGATHSTPKSGSPLDSRALPVSHTQIIPLTSHSNHRFVWAEGSERRGASSCKEPSTAQPPSNPSQERS